MVSGVKKKFANTKSVASRAISALTGRLMAQFAGGGGARADGEVVGGLRLLWGEGFSENG